MAIKALDLDATREIVSKYDDQETEEDGATVWIIGAVDSGTAGRIKDSTTVLNISDQSEGDGSFTTNMARRRANWETVAAGLRGFRNFLHPETGEPVQFRTVSRDTPAGKRKVVSDDVMRVIPLAVIDELADRIGEFNEFDEDDLGN